MKLDHIVILLSDLKRNLGFYEALLPLIGFTKERDHVFGNKDGLYLDFKQSQLPEHSYQRYAPGLNHLGFTAPDVETILDIQSKMSKAGFDVPELQHFPGSEALFFKDAEGMRVELTNYHPDPPG
jgi:lactoylglutathione lyase